MSTRPVFTLRVHVFKLSLLYLRYPCGMYGTCLMVGSRNWLKPGAYLWSVTVKRTDPNRYRKWRSVWRRPLHTLNMRPVYSSWHRRSRRK